MVQHLLGCFSHPLKVMDDMHEASYHNNWAQNKCFSQRIALPSFQLGVRILIHPIVSFRKVLDQKSHVSKPLAVTPLDLIMVQRRQLAATSRIARAITSPIQY